MDNIDECAKHKSVFRDTFGKKRACKNGTESTRPLFFQKADNNRPRPPKLKLIFDDKSKQERKFEKHGPAVIFSADREIVRNELDKKMSLNQERFFTENSENIENKSKFTFENKVKQKDKTRIYRING